MTVEDLIVEAKAKIHSDQAKILLGDILELNPLELLLHLDDEVSDEKVKLFRKYIEGLNKNIPIQYIMGYTNFYGYRFKVNKNVLIPRFETEELVENTIKIVKELFPEQKIALADLGCGSGALGITLKINLPTATVDLIDISKEALKVAEENSNILNKEVNLIENDMLENINKKYDLIISNPPYIREDEEIEEIVKENEPHLALYGGKDGLDYYRKILSNIKKNLKEKYVIAFEIGYKQKNDIIKIIEENLKNVKIITKKDMQERDRMIFIISNNLYPQ